MPTFTSGNDTFIVHTAGTFDLDFLEGDDTLTVQGGTSTTAHMGLGNDVVQLKSGLATVFGDAGADRFEIYAANATVDGGDDNDLINIRGGSGISASGGLGDDRFNFYADSSGVTLYGDEGDDDFYGYNHNVAGSLYGGAGNDYFVLFQTGAILLGGPGNDIYRITVGSPASVVESVGEGTDSVQIARGYNYALPDNVENISVRGFTGSGSSSATLVGNTLNNHITAHKNDETIDGLDGNDNISGKGGNDTIDGGNGDDRLDGGSGNDSIQGGDGDDVINGRDGSDLMAGGIGNDSYYVDATADVILEDPNAGIDIVRTSADFVLPSGVENGIVMNGADVARLRGNDLDNILYGSLSGDFLAGEAGNDKISGGGGDDRLYGGSGDDYLQGGEGRDEIVGGVGTDVIYGGAGGDTLSGGEVYLYKSVADSSVQTGRDSVTLAFTAVVDLSRIDANSTIEGNQAFTVVDTPTGHEGELWFVFEPFLDEGSVIDSYYWMNVYGDVDGDGVADLAILMVNPGGFTPDNLPSNFII